MMKSLSDAIEQRLTEEMQKNNPKKLKSQNYRKWLFQQIMQTIRSEANAQ